MGTSLGHTSGLYADAYLTSPIRTTVDSQQFSFDIGYEKQFSTWVTLSAEFSQYFYSSETANIFSQFSNTISVNAEFDFSFFDFGLSYDQFLGGSGASYFSFDISTFQKIDPVYILLIFQVTYMSQTVDETYLVKGKGKGKKKDGQTIVTTDLTGLANTLITIVSIYPVLENLSLSFVPSFIINHQSELSAESSQFVWNTGLRYNFNF